MQKKQTKSTSKSRFKGLIASVSLFLSCAALAQNPCPPTPLNIFTQTELNQLALDYPNCTEINGDVHFERSGMWDSVQIHDLSPLQNITRINGNLTFLNLPELTSFNGLNIQEITGDLTLQSLNQLSNTTGWNSLQQIGGSVNLSGLPLVTEIDFLTAITDYTNDLTLSFLQSLNSLTHLQQITAVQGSLTLSGLNGIHTLHGLSNLQTVGGNLEISSNSNLQRLDGLNQLTSIGGSLHIIGNTRLFNLDGFLNNSPSFNGLNLGYNSSLVVCDHPYLIAYLAQPEDAFPRWIDSNNADCENEFALLAREAVPTPETTLTPIVLNYQFQVDDFALWFPNATQHSSGLSIRNTPNFEYPITQLSGLSTLTAINGDLVVSDLAELVNLSGLSQLTSINGSLVLEQLHALTSIDALSNVNHIQGDLAIQNCSQLVDLYAFQNLTHVGGRLNIRSNSALNNIDGLSQINSQLTGLTISDNLQLSNCNFPLICSYLLLPESNYPRHIENNAFSGNCRSLGYIQAACDDSACPPAGNLHFTTQAQLAEFQQLFPNCTEIQGDVTIGNPNAASNIIDVSPLSTLRTITGSFKIINNPNLVHLNGLHLETIGQNLYIGYDPHNFGMGNANLTQVDGLANLTFVGNDIRIERNPSLTQLNGLNQISSAVNDINISDISQLTELNSFNLIPSANQIQLSGGLICQSMNAFNALTTVNQHVGISLFHALTEVNGFDQLTFVGGSLGINQCNQLNAIYGFSQLNHVGEELSLILVQAIEHLTGFSNLQHVGHLRLYTMPLLQSLSGFQNVSSIESLQLTELDAITNLDPLLRITEIDRLTISSNDNLTNLHGLANLNRVNYEMVIQFNPELTDISALQNLTFAPEFQQFSLMANAQLSLCHFPNICAFIASLPEASFNNELFNLGTCYDYLSILEACENASNPIQNLYVLDQAQLDALPTNYASLATIPGNVYIGSLLGDQPVAITDLSAFALMQSINGSLYIQNTTALTHLQGLENLTSIGSAQSQSDGYQSENDSVLYKLVLKNNYDLVNSDGLDNAQLQINHLTITQNPALNVCNLPTVCAYLTENNDPSTHSIHSNGTLCNSEEDYLYACESLTNSDLSTARIQLYPNPTKSKIILQDLEATTLITCYTVTGQWVQQWKIDSTAELDLAHLPAGVYFLELENNDLKQTIRLLKID